MLDLKSSAEVRNGHPYTMNLDQKVLAIIFNTQQMSKWYQENSSAERQFSTIVQIENSQSNRKFTVSPPKDQSQTRWRVETQTDYERKRQEGHSEEIEELKQNEDDARLNLQELTTPVRQERVNYHKEKYDHLREKISEQLSREKQSNKQLLRDLQQKEQILDAFEEQRYLVVNEYQSKYDDLQKERKEIEDMRLKLKAQKEQYARKSSQLERGRQEIMQEKYRQESDKSMLKVIYSQYSKAFHSELSSFYQKDEAVRAQNLQTPSIKGTNFQVGSVNLYLSQCLQFFAKIVTQRHQAREDDYKSRLNKLEQSHKNSLEEQREKGRNQLKQMQSELQKKYDELKQKAEKDAQKMTQQFQDQIFSLQENAEEFGQKMLKKQERITFLQNSLDRQRENNLNKLNQMSSQLQQKYKDFELKAKKDLDGQRKRLQYSQQALKAKNEGLWLQKLQKQKKIAQLQYNLITKTQQINQLQERVNSLKKASQKFQDFKQEHQEKQRQYLQLQAELKSDFENKIKQVKQSYRRLKEQKENELNDSRFQLGNKHKEQKEALDSQIRVLNKTILKMQEKEKFYLDDFENLKANFSEKQQKREIYKVEFHTKTTQIIQNIVKGQSAENKNSRQIFSQLTQDLQDKLIQQCKDKQLLCRNYSRLDEKYSNLSKQHFLQSLKLQETTQSLLQVQLKEQMCTNEVSQLRRVLSQIQQLHRKAIQDMQNRFEQKLSTTIEETSQFYQVILNSKEKIYEADLSKCQQELQSLNLIKNIKEKLSADNQRMLQNERQDLKAKIKTMQREHNSALKANKNEIATLTQSNQFLKKSLDLSSQTLQAKQRILQSLQGQKALFRNTINFIHNQLDERSLEQILEELDDSQDVYNQEVVDLVNGIFFSVNGVSVQNKRLEQLNLQLKQEKENLGYILREIEGNAEDKDRRLEKIATQSPKFQEKINSLEAELKIAKSKNEEFLKGLNRAQESVRKSGVELESIRSSEKQAKKENDRLKAKLEQATRSKNDCQRIFSEKESRLQGEFNELKQKIDTLTRERSLSNKELQNSMKREIEQLKVKIQTQATRFTRLQQSIEDLKKDNERLLTEKSTLEKTIADIKKENLQLAEANKLRTREQEPVRRLVTSPNSRDSQKLIQYEQKAILVERQNKKLESDLSSMTTQLKTAKADLTEAKKKISTLLSEINELKRDQDEEPKLQGRKQSWNEQEQLVQGYQQMAKDLRDQNTCLQQEIDSLKAKLKRYQANHQRPIRSYISPPKENGLSDNKSPPKMGEIKPTVQIGSEKKAEEQKRKDLFSTNCIMENDDQGSAFIAGKVEEIFGNKKIESTQMLFKLSQSIKTYSFSSFLSKDLLLSQCYFIIFATKSTKFAILSYKLEGPSRQSAMLFSITNKKTISKRVGSDNNMYQAVSVQIGGDFVVGGGHIRMKPSSKTLAVKDVYRYFEAYDKKEIYGNEHWRDDLIIELSEFEIHRVFLK